MLHSRLLSQLYTCATNISSRSLYRSDENVQVSTLEKIANILPTSETLQVPRDGPFDDTKTLAVAALTKDMTKLMGELSPMPEEPPKVVDRHYIESSMYGEIESLKRFVDLTLIRIHDAAIFIEIYEDAERVKKARLNHDGPLASGKPKKLELEKQLAIAKTRLAYVQEAKERREWHSKIKNLVSIGDWLGSCDW